MKTKKFKSFTAIAIILLLSSIATTINLTQAQTYTNQQEGGSVPGPLPAGKTADRLESTRSFLSFSPTTIGVGQTLLVNLWLNPALHVSRYFKDYAVTITSPTGKH